MIEFLKITLQFFLSFIIVIVGFTGVLLIVPTMQYLGPKVTGLIFLVVIGIVWIYNKLFRSF